MSDNELKEAEAITCEAYWAREKIGEHPSTIDVRSKEEWEQGHIPDATHLPLEKIADEIEQVFPEKNSEIVLCCLTGDKAVDAANKLTDLGYTNVKSLSGGYSGYCGGADNPEEQEES